MHDRQRGVALITALIVLAIAATISAAMIWQGSLDTRRTSTLIQGDQAMQYALGAESWAEQILLRDAQKTQGNINLGQDWAQQLPPLPVEGGQIIGHLEDMQGRFNLDTLVGQNQQGIYFLQFQRLLKDLNLDPTLAPAVLDWVNNGTTPTQNGAKDDFYSRLQPPYLTAMAPMTSVSELELVRGVTPQVYAALAPYVCAIPISTPGGGANPAGGWSLNFNTASPLMLMSLADTVTQDQAAQVVAARENQGIAQGQFTSIINVLKGPPTGPASSYFLLTVTAEIGTTHVTLYSLLNLTPNTVKSVRRTFGTL